MFLAAVQEVAECVQLLGVQMHALSQQQEQVARVSGHSVPLQLLTRHVVVRQLGCARCHLGGVAARMAVLHAPELYQHKVQGMVPGHISVDWGGDGVVEEVGGGGGGCRRGKKVGRYTEKHSQGNGGLRKAGCATATLTPWTLPTEK